MAKKGLGRGLDALLGESKAEDIVAPRVEVNPESLVRKLRIVDIEPNRDQPRRDFDDDSLNELTESIRESGVITPIIVKKADNGFYTIVAGERRWRASKKAGLKEIPAVVRTLTELETQQIALIENLQRRDLNSVEEALGYKRLMDEFSLTQEEVAKKVGKSRSSVANLLRILSLDSEVLKSLKSGEISFGHAKVILGCDKTRQREIAQRIIKEDLSVRATEEIIREKPIKKKSPKKVNLSVELAFKEVEKSVSSSLGANVKIKDKGNKGTVQIEYYSSEELERIVKILSNAK